MGANARSGPVRPLRVLVDTNANVALDPLLRREPWYSEAQPFWRARDDGQLVAYLPASVLTDIFYIGRRQIGAEQARQVVVRCLREFGLLAVYRTVMEEALALSGADFADYVQIACAQLGGLDLIVTRNIADFRGATLPAIEPASAIDHLMP
jgi:predicted nucleic acid-binding protein